jgi:hypothetical protein
VCRYNNARRRRPYESLRRDLSKGMIITLVVGNETTPTMTHRWIKLMRNAFSLRKRKDDDGKQWTRNGLKMDPYAQAMRRYKV